MQIILRALAASVLCLMIAGRAQADPHLTGPLIQSINTDRAFYTNGDSARMTVTLQNNTGGTFTGTITGTVTGRGVQVGLPIAVSVASLPVSATQQIELRIPTNAMGQWQGYLVNITATSAAGVQVDQQAGAIDSSPDWWTYPRQCWVVGTYTDWGGWKPSLFSGPETDIPSLNAYKCNNLQFYNMLYRWHKPWTNAESWINGDGENISAPLIRRNMAQAKAYGMGTFFYMPIYAANYGIAPGFTQDGSGAQLSWGMFTSACGANGGTCQIGDLWKFNDKIAYMNPNNVQWQNYWAQQAKLIVRKFGFDGMFVDTFGTIYRALFDAQGNRIIMDTAYSSFLKTVSGIIDGAFILNPAGSYNEQNLVQALIEAYHFVERWNNPTDIGNFGAFLTKAQQVWGWATAAGRKQSLGLDWDMGMNKTLGASSSCTINGGSTPCTFNTPGVLYQEATMLATGAHHAWIVDGQQNPGDGARFISGEDFPIGNQLSPKPDMVQGEYDYQNFGVAYEKLLRLNISASTAAAPSITSGATGSTTAAAGSVWMFQNHRSGFDILHLLNYQQMSSASFSDVNDNCACAAVPTKTGPILIKMYVTSGGTLGALYTASPDVNHGAPVSLSYSTGSDSSGSYVTFTLPSLTYWDMVWIENGLGNSDYATP